MRHTPLVLILMLALVEPTWAQRAVQSVQSNNFAVPSYNPGVPSYNPPIPPNPGVPSYNPGVPSYNPPLPPGPRVPSYNPGVPAQSPGMVTRRPSRQFAAPVPQRSMRFR